MKKFEIKNVKGSNDYGSSEQIIRNYISDTLKEVFERYGYKPLSTAVLCYYELLTLKYDEDNDIVNEIYKVKDQGDRKLALRYDLTVPFAKYIASNPNIKLPYKRYEIGKVFRDGPVKQGRVREFIQCDVDSVGIEGQMIEAELISLFIEGCKKLDIDVLVKYNNRKLLVGLIEAAGVSADKMDQTITIIDKFEKLTREEINNEFVAIGIEEQAIIKILEYLNLSFEEIKKNFEKVSNKNLEEGINEIQELEKYISELGLSKYTKFTSSLARGQEYYTGAIFEAYLVNGEIKSSIGGGGRYDKMIGDFIGDGKKYPAVGISFGLDVLFEVLRKRNNIKNSNTEVYIIPMGNNIKAMQIASMLREKCINTDVEMNDRKVKKSLDFANFENIPYVLLLGEAELKENKIVIKNMKENMQEIIKIDEIIDYLEKEKIMEKVEYKILNPGGNKTALVIEKGYSSNEKKTINDNILAKNKDVEQVGFIDKCKKKLEMAGGEFCVNATRCAIWDTLNGNIGETEFLVSGYKGKISGGIDENKEVYANMEINKSMSELIKTKGMFNFVYLDGILQVVVDEENSKEYIKMLRENEDIAKQKLKDIMKEFNSKEDAVGIILLESEKEKLKINPVIWVKAIDTIYYETACGSGSLAVAIYQNYKNNTNKLEVLQPSGYTINIEIEEKKEIIKSAKVIGKVFENI